MIRPSFAAVALTSIATAAGAASLSVSPDKSSYNVGETITLTVVADDAGATTYFIFGRLNYSGALVDNGTRTQTPLIGALGTWSQPSDLLAGDDGTDAFSVAFEQLSPLFAQTANNLPGTLSTVTLIAREIGVVDVSWETPGFEFFGLTDAPGASFTIVPEPGTSALVGLGLAALVAIRRRA